MARVHVSVVDDHCHQPEEVRGGAGWGGAKDVKDEKFTGQPSKHNCNTKLKTCVLAREISVCIYTA